MSNTSSANPFPPYTASNKVICGVDNEVCTFQGPASVYYGLPNQYGALKTINTSSAKLSSGFTCGASAFGYTPTTTATRSCYVGGSPGDANFPVNPTSPDASYSICGLDGSTCLTASPALAAYGAAERWMYELMPAGSFACNATTFGGDPAPGINKACYLTVSSTAPPNTPSSPIGTPTTATGTPTSTTGTPTSPTGTPTSSTVAAVAPAAVAATSSMSSTTILLIILFIVAIIVAAVIYFKKSSSIIPASFD